MKNKLLALVLIVAMALSLAVCSTPKAPDESGNAEESASGEKVFRYAVNTEPTTLDPNKSNSIGDNEIQRALTENLTRNTAGKVKEGLAESWDLSDDGTVYTFHLRDSAWSDGTPIKAADFEYSWKRLADPETGSPYQFIVGVLKNGNAIMAGDAAVDTLGVKALDDKTLEVTLEYPTSYFLSMLGSQSNFAPLRQDIVEKYGADFAATADKNFRLVMNYALDREEYNLLANSGVYTPYNALVYPGLQGKDGKTYGETFSINDYAYPITGNKDEAQYYLGLAMEELGISGSIPTRSCGRPSLSARPCSRSTCLATVCAMRWIQNCAAPNDAGGKLWLKTYLN